MHIPLIISLKVALRKRFNDVWFFPFAGIDNNETLKVYGGGGADPDGNRSGDLYATIKVLH